MSSSDAIVVVKLGGSLAEDDGQRLAFALSTVTAAQRPCVVVPGGGTFADAVRAAYHQHGISQTTAHCMALLAMQQTGLLMADMAPRLQPAEDVAEIAQAFDADRVPVWMPYRLAADDPHITHDWRTTSDALAARLAERLGNAEVVLVKSCPVDPEARASALADAGVVDAAFPEIVARAGLKWRVLGAGDSDALAKLLQNA